MTACSSGGHYVVLELTVNNANLGKVLAGDTVYVDCNSKTFITHLNAGDDVFVQIDTIVWDDVYDKETQVKFEKSEGKYTEAWLQKTIDESIQKYRKILREKLKARDEIDWDTD